MDVNQTSLTVGDFNGDGRDEIAILMNDERTIRFYSVNPDNYNISPMSPATLTLPSPIYRGNLIPGRFILANQVDLVAVGGSGSTDITFEYINTQANSVFAPQVMNPAVQPTAITNSGALSALFGYAAPIINPAGPFQPGTTTPAVFGPEQLVLVTENRSGEQNFWIGDFSVDNEPASNYKYGFLQLAYSGVGSGGCILGMQLGNFDHQTSSGGYNAAEQVAFLFNHSGCTSGPTGIEIDSIEVPQYVGYTFSANSWLALKSGAFPSATGNQSSASYPAVLALDVSDVQGRSQQLGAPTVLTINNQTQPQIVLEVPPMHVDYVVPPTTEICEPNTLNPQTGQCVANISYQPTQPPSTNLGSFNTLLSLTSGSSSQTQSTSTTSWGLSVKTSVGAKFSFNDLEENASGSVKDTASALYNSTVANKNSSYTTNKLSVTSETTTQDLLFFEERNMAVYYYPILGLSDSHGNEEYVEFSAPSDVSNNQNVEGSQQDWYQPVHEPGNVLSYPWSYAQIQSGFANPLVPATPSTAGVTCQEVGNGAITYKTSWASNSGQSQTVGSVSSFSNDLAISGSEGLGVSGIDGGSLSFSVDIGTSTSLSSLNEEANTVQASTGVTTNLPSFFNWDADHYFLASFIFGESSPQSVNVLQSLTFTPSPNLMSNGPLFVEYVADPAPNLPGGSCTDTGGQAAWQQMYSLPDVGFNHPQRWHWTPEGANLGVSFEDAVPSDPIKSHFYHMKGFFITSQASAGQEPGGASGPNLSEATIGDQLQLSARIYNFSLRDTDNPTLAHYAKSIHVDFYGQAYCPGTGLVCGKAFEIGHAILGPHIPGFKSTTGPGNNWVLASVPFDTGNFNLQPGPMVFWAVTWMEDAEGKLVPEVGDHGLLRYRRKT